MQVSLNGKVALVTGGARGIGAAIATRLSEAGCFVWVADINEPAARVTSSALPQGAPLCLDVCDRTGLARAADRLRSQHGGLDILVNNAGLATFGPHDTTPPEAFDQLVAVNLGGIYNTVLAFAPIMRGRAGASILNMSSVSHERGGGSLGNVWYGATKAAVVSLTKGLARELGPDGIRVNAIAPGVMDTELVRDLLTPEVRAAAIKRFPLGRFAEPDDVARLVAFLVSDCAGFVTGQTVAVDGGFLAT